MKNHLHKRTAMAMVCASAALLLQACGGGGSDGGSSFEPAAGAPASTAATPAPTDTASVNAFKPGAAPRFQLVNTRFQLSSGLGAFTQQKDGAMTDLNGTKLTGQTKVEDISGDSSFALGRWVGGTANTISGPQALTGVGRGTYHYAVYNVLENLPVSGSFQCDGGAFSAPTSDSQIGSASGNATLSFTDTGAVVGGQINVASGSASASATLSTSGLAAKAYGTTGDYEERGSGAYLQVAEAGNGAYALVGRYRAVMPDGVAYVGVFRFACK